jgi:Transposase DDE domain group 1
VNLKSWPTATRLVCRSVRLAQGTQLGFGQTDGFRYEVFLTDMTGDIRDRDLFQRRHARVEDRIRDAKDLGLRNLPFREFSNNEVWLLLVQLAQDLLA